MHRLQMILKKLRLPRQRLFPIKVDTDASVINWEGYKPGQYGHQGTIKLQGGELNVKNGMPESGNFVIDITSLANTDLEDPEKRANLEGHLKSGDFFEVEKFPTGAFEMTGVASLQGDSTATMKITGNLTLKRRYQVH